MAATHLELGGQHPGSYLDLLTSSLVLTTCASMANLNHNKGRCYQSEHVLPPPLPILQQQRSLSGSRSQTEPVAAQSAQNQETAGRSTHGLLWV